MTSPAGGQQFYSALQKQATDTVGNIFRARIFPVQYPVQGDFKWNWQNVNQVFNDATYQYISALAKPGVVPGTVALSAGGGFANAYIEVLKDIQFSLNKGDQAKLTAAQSNASVQAGTVVSDYQGSYGTITDEQMRQAGVRTKVDYVIGYVLGSLWSGATPPLTYEQMSEARNLRALLPKRPAGSDQVITDVVVYLNLMQPALGYEDMLLQGTWTLNQLKRNTETPTARNGGIQTFDPNTGAVLPDHRDGWGISTPIQAITNDLQNTGRTIQLSMTVQQAQGSELEVHVQGQAGFTVGSWLQFSTEAGASYDMSRVSGASSDCSVSMNWTGYSIVGIVPTAWQQDTDAGFYYPTPIQEAVTNGTQDVTGYKFLTPSQYNFGPLESGGNFGLLTNLLIANYPTISITYTNADYQAFSESWSEQVRGNLKLFGFIDVGSFSQGAYGSTFQRGSSNSTFTVTFSASPEVTGLPQNLKQAFVIGAAIDNPGTV